MAAIIPPIGTLAASEQLIRDLYIDLRRRVNQWAAITHQTAQARMGYIGQHLVSTVTGFRGGKSGARGKDLVLPDDQFSEIKTCYRVDQLGKCNDCGAALASIETECSACGSTDLKRNDDSKWLIGFRNEDELDEALAPTHYYLVLFDFVTLETPDDIRASIWRIDPRIPGFALCMVDYYCNIRSKSKSKAPFNLWPYSPKFQLMRGDLIYQAIISSDDAIDTTVFPGRDPAVPVECAPLSEFARATTIHDQALTCLERYAEVQAPPFLPRPGRKIDRLRLLDAALRPTLSSSAFADIIAYAVYTRALGPHIGTLPITIRPQIEAIIAVCPPELR